MDFDGVIKMIQEHFTDGLVLVVGSGLSAAEGLPGMPAVADHLKACSSELSGSDATLWTKIASVLDTKAGLEAALLKHAPTATLEAWIVLKTSELLIPREREVIGEVVKGHRTLRLTAFLSKILKSPSGLPILTPNYDRLIEVACEMAGFHVDTTAIGHYAGTFDHQRSCMGSCRGVVSRGKTSALDHFPRAIVLKPHGSFDWYRNGAGAIRCTLELDAERLIITPGLNKYKAGYSAPFDKHRELANNHINQSARLLVIGYGFNDDHLQTHLVKLIRDGTPTIILTHTATPLARKLAEESPSCVCLSKPTGAAGIVVVAKGTQFEHKGQDLWDIGTLAKELLG
jgi:hypothetical protein